MQVVGFSNVFLVKQEKQVKSKARRVQKLSCILRLSQRKEGMVILEIAMNRTFFISKYNTQSHVVFVAYPCSDKLLLIIILF